MQKFKNKKLILVGLIVVFGVGWIFFGKMDNNNPVNQVAQKATNIMRGVDGFAFDESTPGYETYKNLIQGCSFKDCIPSIDAPEFESIDNANGWLEAEDVVFVLDYENEIRVYPQRIMNRHEIVNDVVAGDPLVITFCPLCGSALAFKRTLDPSQGSGQVPVLEFGVSGKLYDNDLVMYDRQTETLWQQITGEAIVGELFGQKLRQISFGVMIWDEAKEKFPNLVSLKRPGVAATYNIYPYGDYERDADPLFPIEGGVDSTIHPKSVVFGLEVENEFKAYQEEELKEIGNEELKDKIGGIDIGISYNGGDIEARRLDTGEEVVATRMFWFAWKAFRPDTKLY
jgi:hypothetical protein